MQDNRWDDEFTDHAWAEMRKLLDREMPVGGAWIIRRRVLGMAAAVFLLLLAAGGGFWLRSYEPAPIAGTSRTNLRDEKQPTEEMVVSDASTSPTADGRSEAQAASNLNPADDSGFPIDRVTAKSGPSAKSSTRPGASSEGTIPAVREGGTPVLPLALEERAKDQPVKASATDLAPAGKSESGRSVENGLATGTAPSPAEPFSLEALPLRAVAPDQPVDALPATKPYAQATPTPEPRSVAPLVPDRWGLQGSTVAGGSGLTGLAAGLAADYRLGKSAWSVQTGLRYLYQNRDFAFQAPGGPGSSVAAEDSRGPSQDTVTTSVNQKAFNPRSFPVAAMTHSLNLPVVLNYQVGKRLGVQLGVQMSYAVLTQRTNAGPTLPPSGSFVGNGLSPADEKTIALVSTPADNSISSGLLQRWDAGITGGLQFQALPRLEVQMRYNFGLADLVRSEYYASYNRFFSLGVVYYLQ